MVFVVSPKLLHLLGAERFGVLMIALVTPLIASQLDLGITSAAVAFASRLTAGRIDAGDTLFTFFVALLVIGLALGISSGPARTGSAKDSDYGDARATQGQKLVGHAQPGLRSAWPRWSLASSRAPRRPWCYLSFVQTAATVVLWVGALLLLQRTRRWSASSGWGSQ